LTRAIGIAIPEVEGYIRLAESGAINVTPFEVVAHVGLAIVYEGFAVGKTPK
jgi:hypothetical protein